MRFRSMPFGFYVRPVTLCTLASSLQSQITRQLYRTAPYCAPMRVHLYTLGPPRVTSHRGDRSPPRASRSRRVTSPRAVRRGGTTARPTSRLPWRRVSPAPCCSCPRHHAITSHHMCPAEPSHAPRLVSGGGLLPLLRLLRLHRRLKLADGWGAESSRNERTHARIRNRRNGGAVARGVRAWAGWVGCLGRR